MSEKNADWKERLDRRRLAFSIETIRESRGLTKEELARKVGYKDAGMITALENASKSPDDDKIKDLANALDVSIEQLRCFSKIEISEKGWPRLSENEKIALNLIAPMMKDLSDKQIRQILDMCLMCCKAAGKTPAWKQAPHQKEKALRVEDYLPEFRKLYDLYMCREIGIHEMARKLGVEKEDAKELIRQFTEPASK